MILLDSDVLIDVLRDHPSAVQWAASVEGIALPGYVIIELVAGCANKAELRDLQGEMRDYRVVWPSPHTCQMALTCFMEYHLSRGLRLLDTFVGHLALELGVPLHTFNEKHYQVIAGLKTVQPYQR